MELKLDHGFGIKANDVNTIQLCKDIGVIPSNEENLLYIDNCTGDCPMKRWCSGIDYVWWCDAMKRNSKLEKSELRAEKRIKLIDDDQQKLNMLKEDSKQCSRTHS